MVAHAPKNFSWWPHATRHNFAIKPARPFPSGMLGCFTLIARSPPCLENFICVSHRRPLHLLGLPGGLLLLFDFSFNPKHWPYSSIYRLLLLEPVSESGPRISFLARRLRREPLSRMEVVAQLFFYVRRTSGHLPDFSRMLVFHFNAGSAVTRLSL